MLRSDYLLVALAAGQFGLVSSLSCATASDGASRYLDFQGACDAEPQCKCDYTPKGYFYSSCVDSRRQCSALDPDVCGSQEAVYMYTFYPFFTDHVVVYTWTYDGATRGEKLRYTYTSSPQPSCSVVIIDDQNVETECSCRHTTCNGEMDPSLVYSQIDCSNYESGAVADECLPNMGVKTGSVLEGLAVTWSGMCVRGGGGASPVAGNASPTRPPTRPPIRLAPTRPPTRLAPTRPPTRPRTRPPSRPEAAPVSTREPTPVFTSDGDDYDDLGDDYDDLGDDYLGDDYDDLGADDDDDGAADDDDGADNDDDGGDLE